MSFPFASIVWINMVSELKELLKKGPTTKLYEATFDQDDPTCSPPTAPDDPKRSKKKTFARLPIELKLAISNRRHRRKSHTYGPEWAALHRIDNLTPGRKTDTG
jgi:hypothetical protein